MPAALDVNREAVRLLVVQYGVREAARQMGLNEDTVAAWSARGKWLADLPRSVPLPPSMVRPASDASNPAQALAKAMLEDSVQTRASLLRTTRRAVARAERCDDDELMTQEVAGVLHSHAKTAALAGGWATQTGPGLNVNLRLAVTAQAEGPVLEAEVVDDPPSS